MPSDAVQASDFFECTQCGRCCKGFGGTYIGAADIAAIAEFLKISPRTVREKFCVLSGDRHVLTQRADGYCVFWEQNCTIHPVKPLMCRRWPFIPSLLVDIANWRIMADSCPGIRPDVNTETLRDYAFSVIGSVRK